MCIKVDIMIYIKDLFSLLNIVLIIYLLNWKKADGKPYLISRKFVTWLICIAAMFLVRFLENRVQLHIVYDYLTILAIALVIGHFLIGHDLQYSFIVSLIFLSVVTLGQFIGCILIYLKNNQQMIYQLPDSYQVELLIIIEIVIVIGTIATRAVARRIPSSVPMVSLFTITTPLIINIIIMAVGADSMYFDSSLKIGNIESAITILILCVAMVVGNISNLIVLEYYLNVKTIEEEKKLRISEMSIQYDYYLKLSKDMENIHRLSHDINNHLEALKGNTDKKERMDYVQGIQNNLEKYQSYYKTGNTFVDSILHSKKLEATELDIQFKIIADFLPFRHIKNEDLCVIISNMLDNAIRECKLLKQEISSVESLIQLKAGRVRGFLSIVCENSIRKSQIEIVSKSKELETTKKDKHKHGYGIKNIESAVRKYGGEMSIAVVDDMFCLSVIIPIDFQ